MHIDPLLSIHDLCKHFGVCRNTITNWRKNHRFPTEVRVGPRMIRFPLSEVLAWGSSCSASTCLGEPTVTPTEQIDLDNSWAARAARERFGFVDRVALLDYARDVGSQKRVAMCLTRRLNASIAPTLHYRANTAGFDLFVTGLRRCESWACPVCSEGKARALRSRLEKTVAEMRASGDRSVMMTLSMRHDAEDLLRCLLTRLTKAWKCLTEASVVRSLRKTSRLKKWAWVIELEHTSSGWHPHLHVLATVGDCGPDVAGGLSAAWCDALKTVGGEASIEVGCRVTPMRDNVSQYLTKQWMMTAKPDVARTPLQIGLDAMANPADEVSRRLYREFMVAMSSDGGRIRSYWVKPGSTEGDLTTQADAAVPGAPGYTERVLTYDEVLQLQRGQKRVPILQKCLNV